MGKGCFLIGDFFVRFTIFGDIGVQSHPIPSPELSKISIYFGCRDNFSSLDTSIDFMFGSLLVGLMETLHQQ